MTLARNSQRGTALAITVLLVLVAQLVPRDAQADLASHFGINPRSMGLAGAYTAVSDDLAALYYNPAGLVQLSGMTAAGGVLLSAPALAEDGKKLSMPAESSWHLGVGVPFTGKLKDHLSLGFSLNVPFGKLFRATLYRKQDPYFVLYDAAVQLLQLRVGVGFRVPFKPLSFLSFGVAIQVLSSVFGDITLFAPFQRGGEQGAEDPDERLETSIDLDVPTKSFVTAGMIANIGKNLRVGLAYRQQQFIGVELPITIHTRVASTINLPVDAVAILRAKYYPQQVSLGVAYRRAKWLVTADLTWVDYSAYEIPYARIKLNIERLTKDPGVRILLGPDATLLDPLRPTVKFNDVFVPRVGAEYWVKAWLAIRGGVSYERSPLLSTDFPIYDNDKLGVSLSVRGSFLKPLGLLPGWLHLDLSIQELVYLGRGVLGSDVGGHIFALFTGMQVVLL